MMIAPLLIALATLPDPRVDESSTATTAWPTALDPDAPDPEAEDDELIDTTPDDGEEDHARTSTTMTPLWGMGERVEFDIPVREDHRYVERWVQHFQGRGRERFAVWVSRATRAAAAYYPILREHGLPNDLLFLSMVESGFSAKAYSWAHAAGPWQFIPQTGRRYGLTIDDWVDARRDIDRSTHAAARYLAALHAEFGDWPLAWAGYNAGEARVRRAIRRAGTKDIWALIDRRLLPRETSQYVPKLVASALVSKQLDKYGIEVHEWLEPIASDTLTVTVATDLATIAAACGDDVAVEEIEDLNHALYRKITPPGRAYPVRVPKYWGHDCAAGLAAMDPTKRVSYRFHHLRRGDTAESIAARYGTSVEAILAHNKIGAQQIGDYEAMAIPIPYLADATIPVDETNARWIRSPPFTPDSPPVQVHRVRPGESLWSIANKYRVSLRQIRAWNGIWGHRYLRVGQRIVVRRSGS